MWNYSAVGLLTYSRPNIFFIIVYGPTSRRSGLAALFGMRKLVIFVSSPHSVLSDESVSHVSYRLSRSLKVTLLGKVLSWYFYLCRSLRVLMPTCCVSWMYILEWNISGCPVFSKFIYVAARSSPNGMWY